MNMARILVTYEHATIHPGILLQIFDRISMLTPLRDQGSMNFVAAGFYDKTNELDNIRVP